MRVPSSRGGHFHARLALFDIGWALLSPLAALYLSSAFILTGRDIGAMLVVCSVLTVVSLLSFLGFRTQEGLTQYFSVSDALGILKAVVVADLLAGAALFLVNRLEGIPRSALLVHALVLAAGLLSWRLMSRMLHPENRIAPDERAVVERILMIGASKLAARYIQLLDALSARRRQVVALLDDRPSCIGRSVMGVRVVGPASQIEATIKEYLIHGIHIDRVIVGEDADRLADPTVREVRRVCDHYKLPLEFVSDLIGPPRLKTPEPPVSIHQIDPLPDLPPYFRLKRIVDIIASLILLIVLSPVLLIVCGLALFDVGSPILFWQQRLGRNGQPFLLYKIRTLRPPFDWRGRMVPDEKRLSAIGQLLRKTRLDEIPQLLNVIVGDMSLIGPRPLLPQDQPDNPEIRLAARPGLTGWAQVNGGTSLSPQEKHELDEWYLRNASVGLDLRVLIMTMRFLFTRNRDAKTPVTASSSERECDEERPGASAVRDFGFQSGNLTPM